MSLLKRCSYFFGEFFRGFDFVAIQPELGFREACVRQLRPKLVPEERDPPFCSFVEWRLYVITRA